MNNNNNNNNNRNEINTNDNTLTAIGQLVRDKIVTTIHEFKPRTTTKPTNTEQTITFTKDATVTGKKLRCVRKTSRKRNPQRAEKRKVREQQRETDKVIDGIFKVANSGNEDEDRDEESGEPTSTPIDVSNEETTSAAEEQQLADDLYQHEYEFYEAGQ